METVKVLEESAPVAMPTLKAPFPYFGGKSRVSHLVWDRFGDVDNFVEPFAGSLAVLLARPTAPRVETVNDLDCYLANFWRAISIDPEAVATHTDWPVNEADLHARHLWLVNRLEFRELMKTDPDFYDAKIAGWWVWGISQWIGSGWCANPEWMGRTNAGRADRGIHRKRPIIHGDRAGNGIHGDFNAGMGGDPAAAAPGRCEKRPMLSGHGSGVGVHAERSLELVSYFQDLAERLRRVRVCCGDWTRVLGPSVTVKQGACGVFLDPPYDMRVVSGPESRRDGAAPSDGLYSSHDNDLSAAVRQWATENGDNPDLRIALCGYAGEHDMPSSWECVHWKAAGGYGSQGSGQGRENADRERIWFSPHCLKVGLPFSGALEIT